MHSRLYRVSNDGISILRPSARVANLHTISRRRKRGICMYILANEFSESACERIFHHVRLTQKSFSYNRNAQIHRYIYVRHAEHPFSIRPPRSKDQIVIKFTFIVRFALSHLLCSSFEVATPIIRPTSEIFDILSHLPPIGESHSVGTSACPL